MQFCVFNNDQTASHIIAKYPNLESMLVKATLTCENWAIRHEIGQQLKKQLVNRSKTEEMQSLQEVVSILLFKVLPITN